MCDRDGEKQQLSSAPLRSKYRAAGAVRDTAPTMSGTKAVSTCTNHTPVNTALRCHMSKSPTWVSLSRFQVISLTVHLKHFEQLLSNLGMEETLMDTDQQTKTIK